MIDSKILYENIKKYRKEKKLSQDELARLAGYKSNSMIAQIESGLVDLSFSKILNLAEILEVPAITLMGLDDASQITSRMELLPDSWKRYMMYQLKFAEMSAAEEKENAKEEQ